jgi:methylenetetrahydrofolate--tRNA-(uracil-5-)-methyltransferase
LTSQALAEDIDRAAEGKERLFFYDAIAPTLDADTIDYTKCYFKDRYGEDGKGDYLNIALDKEQYENFISEIKNAEKVPLHSFEKVSYFESCLPIEVMIERGDETLRFGPLKPVGLERPEGGRPWAVIQLRAENVDKTMFSMVGFQTKMKWPEQKRIFSMLPGLENAEFLRLGSIHKNTYVQGPEVLNEDLSLKSNSRVFLAGQLTGVEGYTESSAIGLLAGRFAASKINAEEPVIPPKGCMIGALHNYVTMGNLGKYSPMNANLGLLPGMKREKGMSKADKKAAQVKKANEVFKEFCEQINN